MIGDPLGLALRQTGDPPITGLDDEAMEKDTAKLGNGTIPLTDRERQCLALVYNHMNSKQIAAQLGISPSTVETHIKKVRERMGGIDRWTAARKVFEMEGAPFKAIAPLPNPLPNAWGSPPMGIHTPETVCFDEDVVEGVPDHDITRRRERGDTGRYDAASRHPTLRTHMDPPVHDGNPGPGFQLGTAGTATHEPVQHTGQSLHGAAPDLRDPQASPVQAFGNGVEGDPLRGQHADGRILLTGNPGRRTRNNLTIPQRIAVILGLSIMMAIAFGGLLSGMVALSNLYAQ